MDDNLPSRRRGGDLKEVEIVQNPALGAFLLWRMGAAFQERNSSPVHLELYFIALSILFHRPTLNVVVSTLDASGLSQFVAKMHQEEDELLAIHARAVRMRGLTLRSINVGVAAGLLAVHHQNASIGALDVIRPADLPSRLGPMKKSAVKLGHWFGDLSVSQIFTMLRVIR